LQRWLIESRVDELEPQRLIWVKYVGLTATGSASLVRIGEVYDPKLSEFAMRHVDLICQAVQAVTNSLRGGDAYGVVLTPMAAGEVAQHKPSSDFIGREY
jgi:hypothetical protein